MEQLPKGARLLDIDYSDPRIQQGLSDLAVFDFISGQCDRHPGNIYIDPVTGKVTGIDEDFSFPELDPRSIHGPTRDRIVPMPDVISKETADKLLRTDLEEFRALLERAPSVKGPQPLSKDAIDGAVSRLKAMQDELKKPNGSIKVVARFDRQTYDDAIKKHDSHQGEIPNPSEHTAFKWRKLGEGEGF
jgi:hypothetical protein